MYTSLYTYVRQFVIRQNLLFAKNLTTANNSHYTFLQNTVSKHTMPSF